VLPRRKQRFSFAGRAQLALMEVCGVAILNEASAYAPDSGSAVGGRELEEELRSFALDEEGFEQVLREEVASEEARRGAGAVAAVA